MSRALIKLRFGLRYGQVFQTGRVILAFPGGVGCGLIFKKGEVLRKVPEEELLTELLKEIEKL